MDFHWLYQQTVSRTELSGIILPGCLNSRALFQPRKRQASGRKIMKGFQLLQRLNIFEHAIRHQDNTITGSNNVAVIMISNNKSFRSLVCPDQCHHLFFYQRIQAVERLIQQDEFCRRVHQQQYLQIFMQPAFSKYKHLPTKKRCRITDIVFLTELSETLFYL